MSSAVNFSLSGVQYLFSTFFFDSIITLGSCYGFLTFVFEDSLPKAGDFSLAELGFESFLSKVMSSKILEWFVSIS